MADKRKAKGTKPTGQRKSARQDNESAEVVADKENSHAVTSANERPRPQPIKKSTVRENAAEGSEIDKGASMAVEALLSIRNGKTSSSPAIKFKVRHSSPIEHIFPQVTPGCNLENDWDCDISESDGINNRIDISNLNNKKDPDDASDVKSSDEDGMRCTTWANIFLTVSYSDNDGEQTDQLHELFDVPFEVPFEGATRNLSGITSHTSFNEFLSAVAKRMETRLSLLARIAYIPSYKPKNPKPVPKLLEDDDDWKKLLVDVEEYRTACIAKCKGKGTVKQFVIVLVDMSGPDGKSDQKKVRTHRTMLSLFSCQRLRLTAFLRVRRKQLLIHPASKRFPVKRNMNYSVILRRNTCVRHVTNRAMSYQMASITYTVCRISLHGHSYL
jgi:hypothetical protein